MNEYQKVMKATVGGVRLTAKRNKELAQPSVKKIKKVLERIGKDEGYSVIFDAANANIVYADKALDLTEKVLEELNKVGQ